MAGRIEVPGQPEFAVPSPTEQLLQAVLQQLGQQTQLLSTLCGQLDMGLRLASGQHSKHEVKVKFEENDARVRAMQAAQAKAASDDAQATEG